MRVLALGGVAGPALLSLAVLVAASLRPDYSHVTQFISELGATGTPDAGIMNYGGFLPGGVLLAAFGVSLAMLLPRSRPALMVSALSTLFGLGVAASGLVSCDPGCPQAGGSLANSVHDKIAPISFLCLIVAAGVLGVHLRRQPAWRLVARYSVLTSVVALVLLAALVGSLETRDLTGLWQRLLLASLFLWTSVIGIRVFRRAGVDVAGGSC